MRYEKDIKKLVKEKNRLQKIFNNIGCNGFSPSPVTDATQHAKEHVKSAIEEIHKAELELRKHDWRLL